MPPAITRNISAVRPTCQKMTRIKYDTRSLCHHRREGHFPLEWDGGWCRADLFFFGGTNRPNAAFESSKILPVSQLHYFQETSTNRRLSGCRHTSTFTRSITFVGWTSSFSTRALSCHSKLHLKRRSSSVHCCLVLFLYEMPFWPFLSERLLVLRGCSASIDPKPFKTVLSAVMTCYCEEQCFRWEVM